MEKYWAIDYVNGADGECELVYDDQLYRTEEEAAQAARDTGRPDLFDVSWYTLADLDEMYNHPVAIDLLLKVHWEGQ